MKEQDLFKDLINILENTNNFMIGLTVFVFILFVVVYGLIQVVVKQQAEINSLKEHSFNTKFGHGKNKTNWKD